MSTYSEIQVWEAFFRERMLGAFGGKLVVNRKDGSVLVHIPSGGFEMGDDKHANCPKHLVELSDYWIGVNCVTNLQYSLYFKAVRRRNFSFIVGKENHPVINILWPDAEAYAKWAGCELPTEAQWEKAARGPLGLKYPWGNEWMPELCRNEVNKGSDTTAKVYEYPQGVSAYGTYNQSGNVWEWCRDWFGRSYYSETTSKDPRGPKRGSSRVYRGGSWSAGRQDRIEPADERDAGGDGEGVVPELVRRF